MVSSNLSDMADAYTSMYAEFDILGILGLGVGSALGFIASAAVTATVLQVTTGNILIDNMTDAVIATAVGFGILGLLIYAHNRTGGGMSLLFGVMAMGALAGSSSLTRKVSQMAQSVRRSITRSQTVSQMSREVRDVGASKNDYVRKAEMPEVNGIQQRRMARTNVYR